MQNYVRKFSAYFCSLNFTEHVLSAEIPRCILLETFSYTLFRHLSTKYHLVNIFFSQC